MSDRARLIRCIEMAMGCLDATSANPDERLAWHRLHDALEGREPRNTATEALHQIHNREWAAGDAKAGARHAAEMWAIADEALNVQSEPRQ